MEINITDILDEVLNDAYDDIITIMGSVTPEQLHQHMTTLSQQTGRGEAMVQLGIIYIINQIQQDIEAEWDEHITELY
jgi:hypothetical protein